MRLLALLTLFLVAIAVLSAAAPVKKAVKPAVVTTTKKPTTKRPAKQKIASPNADLLELDQLMLR